MNGCIHVLNLTLTVIATLLFAENTLVLAQSLGAVLFLVTYVAFFWFVLSTLNVLTYWLLRAIAKVAYTRTHKRG